MVRFTLSSPALYRGSVIAVTVRAPAMRRSRAVQESLEVNEFSQLVQAEFEEGIRDWVRLEKRKDRGPGGDDEGKSNKEIAEYLMIFLGLRPPLFGPDRDSPAARADAGEKLMKDIGPFLARREQGQQELGVMADWLKKVGEVWIKHLAEAVPAEVDRELYRLWTSRST